MEVALHPTTSVVGRRSSVCLCLPVCFSVIFPVPSPAAPRAVRKGNLLSLKATSFSGSFSLDVPPERTVQDDDDPLLAVESRDPKMAKLRFNLMMKRFTSWGGMKDTIILLPIKTD